MATSHLLLDIEGTTCPVSFVAETLFPYAAKSLGPYLENHGAEPEVAQLIAGAELAWAADPSPEASQLRGKKGVGVVDYLQLLIQQDRKLLELKELQGLIWKAGYDSGELIAPLFDDVAPTLINWQRMGKVLAVYSSGSVGAQKLLYGHSNSGDLSNLFSHWFDTRTGAKNAKESYELISKIMQVESNCVLFVSDSLGECEAAAEAGMAVCFSDREGNPGRDGGEFKKITTFSELP